MERGLARIALPHAETFMPTGTRQLKQATPSQQRCFHCGDDVPEGSDFRLVIGGEARDMCCPGCRAIAQLIADSGMTRFYAQRTEYNQRPAEDLPGTGDDEQYRLYDDEALASTFSAVDEDGLTHARLLLGGMTCAACTWLIEQSLAQLAGIRSATVNLSQSRLDVILDRQQLSLSQLFTRVAALGYSVQPFHANAHREQMRRDYRGDLRRLSVAGIGMMQVGMFAIALHAGDLQGIAREYEQLLRVVSLGVTAFVVAFSARPFFASAWRHLCQGALVMDLPVALAIGLAFGASVYATVTGSGQVYFDSVVMFTFLLLLARFAEKRARLAGSLDWFDAESALPDAVLIRNGNDWQRQPRKVLKPGDRVLVRAGDTVPIDGVVGSGDSAVREDAFSGESLPRPVTPGDTVYAGTVNTDAALDITASVSYLDTRLAALQESIETASAEKPPIAQIADRVAGWFIGGILLATASTAWVWYRIAPDQALWVALSVLVISCPCALALATPAALSNAANALRRGGVLVRGEGALESIASVSHVLFDKTGTLTRGELTIGRVVSISDVPDTGVLSIAAALQRYANHPIARAFTDIAPSPDIDDVRYEVGRGVSGTWRGITCRMGGVDYCREIAPGLSEPPQSTGYWIALCAQDQPLAWIGLEDTLRSEAIEVTTALQSRGAILELVTGDHSPQGQAMGSALHFDSIHTGMTPKDKSAHVAALQAGGATVLMIGDGLNDAPVLRRANASIAVAGATDLARTQADFVVMDGDLHRIITIINKAQQCRRTLYQNLAWALGYNCVGIPLAALGYVPPWAAAIGMSLSSLLVVANSLRLAKKPRRSERGVING
ncbi:MAG: heavy metal translocating P-type ATPase [Chromatocurvus sp.]